MEKINNLEAELLAQGQGEKDMNVLRSRHAREESKLQDEIVKLKEEEERVVAENKRLAEQVQKFEDEHGRLRDAIEELRKDCETAENDAADAWALNEVLEQRAKEMEVRIEAQQKYESDFDVRVTEMLDERDRLIRSLETDREALQVKINVLQEELGLKSRIGGESDAQERLMQIKEMQLQIEDLEDKNEELELEVARLRQEIGSAREAEAHAAVAARVPAGALAAPAAAAGATEGDKIVEELERRLAAFKADLLEKDKRLLHAEKKLEEFAQGLGAPGLMEQNRELERQVENMEQQVAEAKRDLSLYLSEAASIVYENDLLRQFANISPERLDVQEYKLREKVTSARSVALQKQLEREVAELEEERVKLKRRVRQMSELASEKLSLLHDLQPEQMLQLEEIAASLRKGKLELPMTDESRQLRKEKEALEKRIREQDRELAEHVDRKMDELLSKAGVAKELETKVAALEKENAALKDLNAAVQQSALTYVSQAGAQVPSELMEQLQSQFALLQQQAEVQAQLQAQMQSQQHHPPPWSRTVATPKAPPHDMAASMFITRPAPPAAQAAALGTKVCKFCGRGPGSPTPVALPRFPGLPAAAWSTLLQTSVALPRELATDPNPTDVACVIYCQLIEALEELRRERELRSGPQGWATEVEDIVRKYDSLLSEQETLYSEFYKELHLWAGQRKALEERVQALNEELADSQRRMEAKERDYSSLKEKTESEAGEAQWKHALIDAMARIAQLEQSESMLARRCDAERQDLHMVKRQRDDLLENSCARERFLKERLAKILLWKRRSANALKFARRKLQAMVPREDLESVRKELEAQRKREVELCSRQMELMHRSDRKDEQLREMQDVGERCARLDNLAREIEQEYTVIRQRLQGHEPKFAEECALWSRVTCELQKAAGSVGQWDAVVTSLVAAAEEVAARGGRSEGERGLRSRSVEASLEEKLRELDANHDGFVTVAEVRGLLETLGVKISDAEACLFAVSLHPSPSGGAALPVPADPAAPTPAEVEAVSKANVSVLGVVGRFRLYGLRPLGSEDLFWCAVQHAISQRPEQVDSQRVLRTWFQPLRAQDGLIVVNDVLRVLGTLDVPVERLPLVSLRRVLGWFGLDARTLDAEAPFNAMPKPEDPREAEIRTKLGHLKVLYQEFADRLERGTARALQVLRPPPAPTPAAAPQPASPDEARLSLAGGPGASLYIAQAREAAASRRCVVLEQEVRAKMHMVQELQRQVGELEQMTQGLEKELHDERIKGVTLQTQMSSMVARSEVEPRLRELDQLAFKVEQSRVALKQSEDMARVCAAQAENYEQLVKRRHKEVRTLEDTVKMLQATTEVGNNVGKLQYRLLLSQWECATAQRRLSTTTQDVRDLRKDVLRMEDDMDAEREQWTKEEKSLSSKISAAEEAAEKYREQVVASVPIDKARELMRKMKDMAEGKGQLQQELAEARKQLYQQQVLAEDVRLQAKQAEELMKEIGDEGELDTRKRMLDMAKKLSEAKLELVHLRTALDSAEKEIKQLQSEVAEADARLATQEEQWREKILDVQRAAIPGAKGAKGAAENAAQLQEKLSEREARVVALEAELEREKAAREHAVAEERLRMRKLEADISMMSQGDPAALRHSLRQEFEAELQQISEAAKESVHALQALLDQSEARNAELEEEKAQLLQARQDIVASHHGDITKLHEALSQARQEHLHAKHQLAPPDFSATALQLPPLSAPGDFDPGNASFDSSFALGGQDIILGRLDERLQEVAELKNEIVAHKNEIVEQRANFNRLLEQQHAEARRAMETQREEALNALQAQHEEALRAFAAQREEAEAKLAAQREEAQRELLAQREDAQRALTFQRDEDQKALELQHSEALSAQAKHREDYLAHHEERERAFRLLEEDFEASRREAQREAQRQAELLQQQIEISEQNLELAGQHAAASLGHQQAADMWQAEAERLRDEVLELKERYKESTLRKQQAQLRRQLVGKEEQLGNLRKAVEDLKDRVVNLTIERERDTRDCDIAKRAEVEMRRRITDQEERIRSLKAALEKLTRELAEQKEEARVQVRRSTGFASHARELEVLLDEAGEQLGRRSSSEQRAGEAVEAADRQARRVEELEQRFAAERLVLQGDVRMAQQDAAEATRRAAELQQQVSSLENERGQLAARVRNLEDARRGAAGAASPPAASSLRAPWPAGVGAAGARSRGGSPGPGAGLSSTSRSPTPPEGRSTAELATRCQQLQAENEALRDRNHQLDQDRRRLERERDDLVIRAAASPRDAPATSSAGGAADLASLGVDELRSKVTSLALQNRALLADLEAERRRSRAPSPSAASSPQPLGAEAERGRSFAQSAEIERLTAKVRDLQAGAGGRVGLSAASGSLQASRDVKDLQKTIEDLVRENLQLRRSPGSDVGASQKIQQLQATIDKLARDNAEMRRITVGRQPSPSPSATMGRSAPEVAELKAKVEDLARENVHLVRRSRDADNLRQQLELLRQENGRLRAASGFGRTGAGASAVGLGLGTVVSGSELAELRRLHDEVNAQRKVIEVVCERASPFSDASTAAFTALVKECQHLHMRLSSLTDENVTLRLRLAQAERGVTPAVDARDSSGLPPVLPAPPASLAEAQEANALLRDRFDRLTADYSVATGRMNETAQRIDQLEAECNELRRRASRRPGVASVSGAASELAADNEALRSAREKLEVELEVAAQRRAAVEKQLAAQTARVAALSEDRDALERRLREARSREFEWARDAAGAGGVVLPPHETAAHELGRLRRQVDALENENAQLRKYSGALEEDNKRLGELAVTQEQQQLMDDMEARTLQLARQADRIRELEQHVEELEATAAVHAVSAIGGDADSAKYVARIAALEQEVDELRCAAPTAPTAPTASTPRTPRAPAPADPPAAPDGAAAELRRLQEELQSANATLKASVEDLQQRLAASEAALGDAQAQIQEHVRVTKSLVGKVHLPPASAPQFLERALAVIKRAALRVRRDGEDVLQAAARALQAWDDRGSGALTAGALRAALDELGIVCAEGGEAERIIELLRFPRGDPREASRGVRPKQPSRGVRQGPQRPAGGAPPLASGGAPAPGGSSARGEVRIDLLLERLQAVTADAAAPEPDADGTPAAIHALRLALSRRALSLVAIIADLDPAQTGQVSFASLCGAIERLRLGLADHHIAGLRASLSLSDQGAFATHELLSLLRAAEERVHMAETDPSLPPSARSAAEDTARTATAVRGEALLGLPPPPGATAAFAPQGRARSVSRPARPAEPRDVVEPVPPRATLVVPGGVGEEKQRRQIEALNAALQRSEDERLRLQREVNELQAKLTEQGARKVVAEERGPAKPLQVLLSAGDSAPAFVKELKLEVVGTRDLRDKLFAAECKLEELRRTLEVDMHKELEYERTVSSRLRKDIEDKERACADLQFDLRRARAAAGQGEWEQREEEIMRLNVQLRKLEEDLDGRKRREHELTDKLLEHEHRIMELKFDNEQACGRVPHLEARILELEFLLGSAAPGAPAPMPAVAGSPAKAAASLAGAGQTPKKDKPLEYVVEGLERVIAQQRKENEQLKKDVEKKRDDKPLRAEIQRLKQRVFDLEEELGQDERKRREDTQAVEKTRREVHASLQAEMERKDQRIAELEAQLEAAAARFAAHHSPFTSPRDVPAAGAAAARDEETHRLRQALRELQAERAQDTAALDEAQRALREAELTEQRYSEVARENKRLKADLAALEDEGFWREIEALQQRSEEAVALAKESRDTIGMYTSAFTSIEPPSTLLDRLGRFLAAAAVAA